MVFSTGCKGLSASPSPVWGPTNGWHCPTCVLAMRWSSEGPLWRHKSCQQPCSSMGFVQGHSLFKSSACSSRGFYMGCMDHSSTMKSTSESLQLISRPKLNLLAQWHYPGHLPILHQCSVTKVFPGITQEGEKQCSSTESSDSKKQALASTRLLIHVRKASPKASTGGCCLSAEQY